MLFRSGLWQLLATSALNALAGMAAGALVLGLVSAVQKLRGA